MKEDIFAKEIKNEKKSAADHFFRGNDEKLTLYTTTTESRTKLRQVFNNKIIEKKEVQTLIQREEVTINKLLENGCALGHRTEATHASMRPFIFGKLEGRAIINLDYTIIGIQNAQQKIEEITSKGGNVLIVGTKESISPTIKAFAEKTGIFYVCKKWSPGTLTNFSTIQKKIRSIINTEKTLNATKSEYTKKEKSVMARKLKKDLEQFAGIKNMKSPPEIIIITDVHKEKICVKEANIRKIPVIGICDTNGNKNNIDIPIASNVESSTSISYILKSLGESIAIGKDKAPKKVFNKEKSDIFSLTRRRHTFHNKQTS